MGEEGAGGGVPLEKVVVELAAGESVTCGGVIGAEATPIDLDV